MPKQPGNLALQETVRQVAVDVNIIEHLVQASPDGTVETPTLHPFEISDEAGNSLMVETVKIGKIDANEGLEAMKYVQLSNRPAPGAPHKSIFGLIIERSQEDAFGYELRTTDIIDSPSPVDELPPLSKFAPASEYMAGSYDDGILYEVAFDLRALVIPHDVPFPDEQHPDAVEALAKSGATIPGVAYMGKLLVEPDFGE